jgi:hypothetical protein
LEKKKWRRFNSRDRDNSISRRCMRAAMRTGVNLASTASGAAEITLFGASSESSASKGKSLGQLPLTEAVRTPSTTWQGAEGAYKLAVPSYPDRLLNRL